MANQGILRLDPTAIGNISDNLKRLIILSARKETASVLKKAIKPVALAIRAQAPRGTEPKRPGSITGQPSKKISGSIKYSATQGKKDKMPMGRVLIDRDAFHWIFNEYGTEKWRGHPWIGSAVSSAAGEAGSILTTGMKSLIQSTISGVG